MYWKAIIIGICLALVCSTAMAQRSRAIGEPRLFNTSPFFPATGFKFNPTKQYQIQASGSAPESLRTVDGVTTVIVWRVRGLPDQWCAAQTLVLGTNPVALDSSKFVAGDSVMFEDWPFVVLVTVSPILPADPYFSAMGTWERVHGAAVMAQDPEIHGVPCN